MFARTDGIQIELTAWDDPRAVGLRQTMDVEMNARYAPHRLPDPVRDAAIRQALAVNPADIRATVLVNDPDGTPVAHAALRDLHGEWEVKRVIVAATHRGRGLGRSLMSELEVIAGAGGAGRLILQTGDRQPDAVVLYESLGYRRIPIYEPYVGPMPFSLCFEKLL